MCGRSQRQHDSLHYATQTFTGRVCCQASRTDVQECLCLHLVLQTSSEPSKPDGSVMYAHLSLPLQSSTAHNLQHCTFLHSESITLRLACPSTLKVRCQSGIKEEVATMGRKYAGGQVLPLVVADKVTWADSRRCKETAGQYTMCIQLCITRPCLEDAEVEIQWSSLTIRYYVIYCHSGEDWTEVCFIKICWINPKDYLLIRKMIRHSTAQRSLRFMLFWPHVLGRNRQEEKHHSWLPVKKFFNVILLGFWVPIWNRIKNKKNIKTRLLTSRFFFCFPSCKETRSLCLECSKWYRMKDCVLSIHAEDYCRTQEH